MKKILIFIAVIFMGLPFTSHAIVAGNNVIEIPVDSPLLQEEYKELVKDGNGVSGIEEITPELQALLVSESAKPNITHIDSSVSNLFQFYPSEYEVSVSPQTMRSFGAFASYWLAIWIAGFFFAIWLILLLVKRRRI